MVGYIPDMIFDKELDYLGELAASGVQQASNSVAVQVASLRAAAVLGSFMILRFLLRQNCNGC